MKPQFQSGVSTSYLDEVLQKIISNFDAQVSGLEYIKSLNASSIAPTENAAMVKVEAARAFVQDQQERLAQFHGEVVLAGVMDFDEFRRMIEAIRAIGVEPFSTDWYVSNSAGRT